MVAPRLKEALLQSNPKPSPSWFWTKGESLKYLRTHGKISTALCSGITLLGSMRTHQSFRWWIFLPVLLIFIVPVWMWLGDFLGYDLLIAPDPAPPRYGSELLGSCYYIVWYGLAIFVLLPGTLLTLPLGSLLGDQIRIGFGVILVSLFYSGILFLLRKAYLSSRHRPNDTP